MTEDTRDVESNETSESKDELSQQDGQQDAAQDAGNNEEQSPQQPTVQPSSDVPEKAEDYAITIDGKPFESDSEVDALLHKEGFTQKQAQLVYSLAQEKLAPMVEWAAAQFHSENERQRLVQHFGGEDKWNAAAKQLTAWGKKNLQATTYDALTRTADGVIAIHSMMTNKEPSLRLGSDANTPASDRANLRKMVASPAYWRDKDPDTLRRVHQGFEQLFGSSSPADKAKT